MRTTEDKNIPSRGRGGAGFNPGSINLNITICDYDEEKQKQKETRPKFKHVLPCPQGITHKKPKLVESLLEP